MSSSAERNCPICERKMDDTDIQFTPCQCGYQMCAFCYNRICLAESPQCPNCRARYEEQHISASDPHHAHSLHNHHQSHQAPSSSNANANNNNNKSKKTNTKTKKTSTNSSSSSSTNQNSSSSGSGSGNGCTSTTSNGTSSNHSNSGSEVHHSQLTYEQLSNIRVRQRNLVYAVNLPLASCDETTLKTSKWFGRFGKIKKVYCYKQTAHAQRTGSFAAFITFYEEKEATKAIADMNHKVLDDGRMLKATTGSTKYCSYFLRGANCSNPNCLYLHDWANKEDVVTKEELNDFGSPPYYSHHGAHGQPLRLNFDEKSDDTEHGGAGAVGGGGGYADEEDAAFASPSSRARSASYHDASKNANVIRTVLATSAKPKSATATKISKFDYTRVVKKSIINEQQQQPQPQPQPQPTPTTPAQSPSQPTAASTVNTDSVEYPEFPPLSSGGAAAVSAHTTPVRPQKHRTKPPISHPQHSRSRRQTPALPSQSSDHADAVHAETRQREMLRYSQSAGLSGKNGKDMQPHEQPPQISLDDTQMHTLRARQAQFEAVAAQNKSVNFESEVDIVGGAHTELHVESTIDVKQSKVATHTSSSSSTTTTPTRPRSKSSDGNKKTATQPKPRQQQQQQQRESHSAVARLLLRELVKNRDAMQQRDLQQACPEDRMSDLLKDGMWSIDELVMEQYHYCYFLQSDRVIFEQFHEQYHHHYVNTQKLQKSKA